jgi:Spy/CpxP family protein refolding chaperone
VSIRPLFVIAVFAALVGCANDPAPTEQLRLTDRAVEQAKAVGATEEVEEMALAQSKLVEAHADMASQSFKQARMQAEQAELDARLAEAKVLTAKSQEQLSQVDIRVNRLRKQVRDAQ